MPIKATYTLNIFIAYHPADELAFKEFVAYLKLLNLKNKGYTVNKVWFDGEDLSPETLNLVKDLTESADLILLLLSETSILSPYFTSKVLRNSIQLHKKQKTITVPIILNTCWWEDTAYKELEVLPRAGLPIYDSEEVKKELYLQIIDELDMKLRMVRQKKIELEESFKAILAEADIIYDNWELHPEKLRFALPLYREALDHWREGFIPYKEVLESKINVCLREIDFRHYANAAHEAYKIKDFQTAYYNCKDALALRNDTIIGKLFQELSAYIKEQELKGIREPFEKHLNKAHEYFLSLQWDAAREAYQEALEFHCDEFTPSREVIEHKMEICRREAVLEASLKEAEEVLRFQQYGKAMDILINGVREINRDAFDRMDRLIYLAGLLENLVAYCDKKTNRWGFYDKKTDNIVIAPKYLAAYDFCENLAAVKKWDYWGYIDVEGNEVIPFIYDFVGHFKGGIAEVVKDRETFFINHKGERIQQNIEKKEGNNQYYIRGLRDVLPPPNSRKK